MLQVLQSKYFSQMIIELKSQFDVNLVNSFLQEGHLSGTAANWIILLNGNLKYIIYLEKLSIKTWIN